jgi:two-component system, OmpR family, KDP operon response regulator KdpE
VLITAVIVEDDPQLRRLLRRTLSSHGFRLFEATTAAEGLREAEKHRPDIVLLDLGFLGVDGLQVIRRLRDWSQVPILILSAGGQEWDGVAALEAGADDFVNKPFSGEELLARVQVVLHRAVRASLQVPDACPPLTVGELTVDLVHRRVLVAEQEVHLTPIEYRLLAALVKKAGRVVLQSQLLTEVWGPSHAKRTGYLRVFMTQLRRKLEVDPTRPKYLRNEPGVGYRLAVKRGTGPGGPLRGDRQPRVSEGGDTTTPLEETSDSVLQAGLAVHHS